MDPARRSSLTRAATALVAGLALVGAASAAVASTGSPAVPGGDWPTFDFDAQRSGVGPLDTGIVAANLGRLRARIVTTPGTVDSAAVELHAIEVRGHVRDVAIMTTTYGITFAIDPGTGQRLWQFTPPSSARLAGSSQVTTATPVLDPDRSYVYATSADGYVRKLSVATGRQVWATRVTLLPSHEKLPSSLNISAGSLIVTTDGYYGDAPPYQGHVVEIDLVSGRITHVFNSLCSDRTTLLQPSSCPASDSGIWGRSGTVVEPDGKILVATGNGPFNGSTDWGDSVLELSPTLRLLHNWTPANQKQLNGSDQDIGSTEPALLTGAGGTPLALQGGKDGLLRLLDLDHLDGTGGPAGPRTGGQLQQLDDPGTTELYTTPAVWTHGGRTYAFVADGSATAAYVLGAGNRLSVAWQDGTAGTSPVLAGGLLYVYDPGGTLVIRNPLSGRVLAKLPAASGHWNSPIVVGGRIILPVGSYFAHHTAGTIYVWHLPGR